MNYSYNIGKLEGALVSVNAKFFVLHSLVREFLISFDDSIKLEEFFESIIFEDERAAVVLKIIKAFNYGLSLRQISGEGLLKIYEKITNKKQNFDLDYLDELLSGEDLIRNIYNIYDYFMKNLQNFLISEQFARLCVVLLFTKYKLISYPIFDFSFANRKYGAINNYNDFLSVITIASKNSFDLISNARQVIKNDTKKIKDINVKSVYAIYDYACSNLVIDIGGTAKQLGYTFVTVNKALKHILESKVLVKKSGNLRYKTFIYKALINVFEI